jgi:hypothetical protein
MTNLLSGDRQSIERFFRAAETYYRWPLIGQTDVPVWDRVRRLLGGAEPPLKGVALDIVTFGTPVRYGWDSGGYARLLHFIHHRPAVGLPEYLAPFPPKLDDLMTAARGDYVQQLGIAGTNVMPSVLAWRAWMADQRLGRLLQREVPQSNTLERLKAGMIVPDEGTTLLIDYGRPQGGISEHLAGHAVYTRKAWLLFHAEQVAQQFYGL